MKKLLLFFFFLISGCYYGYDMVSETNYSQGHKYEIKNYETSKVYSHYSPYSKDDAKLNALSQCQNDSKIYDACLNYSYTHVGNIGPLNQESYWESSKQSYLISQKSTNRTDYTKITEWSTIGEKNQKVIKVKPKK